MKGDGSAQFICKSLGDQDKVVSIIENELKMSCLTISIGSNKKIRKAIIPTASYGLLFCFFLCVFVSFCVVFVTLCLFLYFGSCNRYYLDAKIWV